MQAFLNKAIEAIRAGGDAVMQRLDRFSRNVILSERQYQELCRLSTEQMHRVLSEAYPDHQISGTGHVDAQTEYRWLVEPLDGVENVRRQLPHFCLSLALRRHGRLQLGVIYDPMRQDLFTAIQGRGAQKNNRRIRVTQQPGLRRALIAVPTIAADHAQYAPTLLCLSQCQRQGAEIRMTGSAALDLAYTAAGHLDGCWHVNLAPETAAAGAILVREAGGLADNFIGAENLLDHGTLLAADGAVFKESFACIKAHFASAATGR